MYRASSLLLVLPVVVVVDDDDDVRIRVTSSCGLRLYAVIVVNQVHWQVQVMPRITVECGSQGAEISHLYSFLCPLLLFKITFNCLSGFRSCNE